MNCRSHLVDSHCHLDFPDFSDDLDRVVQRAHNCGVTRMVTICTSLTRFDNVAEIAQAYSGVFFAAGIHPHYAATEKQASVEQLCACAQHPKMIGIGESGLDYHYTRESEPAQKLSLETHIAAARITGLPLIIHSRDACDDMADILIHEFRNGAFSCVMHCFSSSAKLARVALDLDFYLSISGMITFRNAKSLRQIFAAVPRNRLLVETDAPYLAPVPNRGQRNEPAFVVDTARSAAQIFNCQFDAFAQQTTRNFDTLFTKAGCWAEGS